MNIKKILYNLFGYTNEKEHTFILPNNPNNENPITEKTEYVSKDINSNLDLIKNKYNTLINSDIVIRNFSITIGNKNLDAFLFFIDGMVDADSINTNILKPLLYKNVHDNLKDSSIIKKINFNQLIYKKLIPQNNISAENKFNTIFQKVNSGFSVLFVDTCDQGFCIEAKKLKGRPDGEPKNETVVRGSQEAFVENLRTNTGLLRKQINNENLIIEQITCGKITNTQIAICYLNNIANNDLVAEIKYRIQNIDIDSLISSGQLEQFITDRPSLYPQIIATERTDRTCNFLLSGRVAILVNGSPFCLIIPAFFLDFLTSPEDLNLNYYYGNFVRVIRAIALFFAIFLPGVYIAITTFHQELIPSELLFAISSARAAIPFPIIFEILLMELSFELIREAGIRVPSPYGQTIGIIRCFNFR